MRYAKAAFVVAFILLLMGLFSPSARAEVSFSVFYSNLSPYGSWHVSGQYGRVWQPGVYASGWNPYYDGHWVYTDLGWTWVSDYEWGAIPYHYGTWVADPDFGWVWVPGYVWAPSWVVFRTGPDYIGWAPVSPGFSVGVSASFGGPAPGSFVFVSAGNFLAPRVRTCIVPQSRTTVIINNTRIVNNIVVENNVVVNRGPDRQLIERASGHRLREVPIEHVSRVALGPRVTRDQLSVDPQRVRHGLRVAEPVSARSPLPNARPREARSEEHRSARLSTTGPAADSPRAPQRLADQRGMKPREYVAKPHGDYPAGRERTRVNDTPATTQMRRAPSRGATSFHQPTRPAVPDRRSMASARARNNAQPNRSARPAPRQDKKRHPPGKN